MHTPGPWRAQRWMEDRSNARVLGPKGETLAVVYDLRNEGPDNQALITAAPDLLAALEGFVDEECHCNTAVEAGEAKCVQCVARAAIAKARTV